MLLASDPSNRLLVCNLVVGATKLHTRRAPTPPPRTGTLPDIDRPDDAELVQAAQAGDSQALEKLLRLHYDRLYAVCRRLRRR